MRVIITNKKQYDTACEDLKKLRKAKDKILNAQSYTMGSNQLNRASLKEVAEEISVYEAAIAKYESSGTTKRRAGRIIPLG